MTDKNSFSGWKTVLRSNLPWSRGAAWRMTEHLFHKLVELM